MQLNFIFAVNVKLLKFPKINRSTDQSIYLIQLEESQI